MLSQNSIDRDIDALLISIENKLGNINRTIREGIIPSALAINRSSVQFNSSYRFLSTFLRGIFQSLFPDGLVDEFDSRFKCADKT